jgi:hypothetical protein
MSRANGVLSTTFHVVCLVCQRQNLGGGGGSGVVTARCGRDGGAPVVMLGSEGDVLHAGLLGDLHPFCGVEERWEESRREFPVLLKLHVGVLQHPLALSQCRVDAPMDEQTEACFTKPLAVREIASTRHIFW